MLFQSECACLHKTVNMVVFFVKSNENTYTKGTHANVQSCPYNEKREYMYLKVRQNKRTLLYSPRQCFFLGGRVSRKFPIRLSVRPCYLFKRHSSLTDELILMKLYIVAVFDLTMCLMKDNLGRKNSKGDNSMGIISCAGRGCPWWFDSQF